METIFPLDKFVQEELTRAQEVAQSKTLKYLHGKREKTERDRGVRTSQRAYAHKIAYHTQPTHDSRVRAHVLTDAARWCNVASVTHPRFERPREMRMSA